MATAPRHVFLCGLHRSGTSILQRLLRAHPDISGFANTGAPEDEGQHLQSVFPPARKFGGPGKFAFAPEAHLTEASPLATDANRKKLAREWGKYWNAQKPIHIEKSPPNIIRTRFLQAMFPGSYFIIITRHPIPVAFATQKWAKTGIDELVMHWSAAHEILREDLPHLKHYHLLRYEDFIAAPEETLKAMHDFIGAPHSLLAEYPKQGINQDYFKMWEDYRKSHAAETARIAGAAEEAAAFGYRFDEPYIGDYR